MLLTVDIEVDGVQRINDGARLCIRAEVAKAVARVLDSFVQDVKVREHRCTLPHSISEALNSGDGTYRP